jgi:hypothetical protein
MCLTHPVTFPVGGNRSTRWKPTTFGRALTSTLFTWGLGSSHIEKFSLRFEPTIFEVKGKCANHFATECGYWGANSSPGCVLVFPLVRSFNLANESMILYPGPKFAPHQPRSQILTSMSPLVLFIISMLTKACGTTRSRWHQHIQTCAECNGARGHAETTTRAANRHSLTLNFAECSTTLKWRSVIEQSADMHIVLRLVSAAWHTISYPCMPVRAG